MNVVTKFAVTVSLLVISTALGYAARRARLVPERAARPLMTLVAVFGYSLVGLLSIWKKDLSPADAWLPALATVHVVILAGAGLLLGRLLSRDRREIGVFTIASAMGNTGFTMGAFVVYLLFGEEGLGLASVQTLMWMPTMVLVLYPIARYHAADRTGESLGRLILRSVFDWRSIGLPMMIAGVLLSCCGPPRPEIIGRLHVVDIVIFLSTATAYFSIGLRLHARHVMALRKMIASLAAVRFIGGPAVGLLLAGLTMLTPLPLRGLGLKVFLIESIVPTAVSMVAIANMFRLHPRVGSLLFVTNTLLYLLLVLPWVLWMFGG